ncbi:MAG: hypothetical protein Q7S74_02165 [Nanoarchaeota archaeon]|nr:hypothetical protein [Nanoarchaeota archaeon]
MEEVLKSLGKLGVLTCYRISSFIELLNQHSVSFKYNFKQFVSEDNMDLYLIQTNDAKVFFKTDEWGNLIENKIKKEEKEKIKLDLINLRKYLIKSIFRTIAYKSVSYKDLNLNVSDFFNGVITPLFLEAYNFYDLDFSSIFNELNKSKINIKKLFSKKELSINVVGSKEKLTITCEDNKIIIPKIKINIKEFTRDYKSRALILGHINKYWIHSNNKNLSQSFLLDPFDLGRPFRFFSEYIIKKAKNDKEFKQDWEDNKFIRNSKISIPETVLEGKEEVLLQISSRLCSTLFGNFTKVYVKKFE